MMIVAAIYNVTKINFNEYFKLLQISSFGMGARFVSLHHRVVIIFDLVLKPIKINLKNHNIYEAVKKY